MLSELGCSLRGLPRRLRWQTICLSTGDLVQLLGQEDPPEKGLATRSTLLALENSMDRGAWWATIHGVAKSWT